MRRIQAITLFALLLGAGSGLMVSKAQWNYFLRPSSTAARKSMEVDSVSFIAVGGSRTSPTLDEQRELLDGQIRQCATSDEDCSFGRVLLRTGTRSWEGLVGPSSPSAELAVEEALTLRASPFSLALGPTLGMVAHVHEGLSQFTIVGLESSDLANDDHHGYAEWLIKEPAQLEDFVVYYFDIAGLEFATPLRLAGLGAFSCASAVVLLLQALRRRERTKPSPDRERKRGLVHTVRG
jgi:hypothetical protein